MFQVEIDKSILLEENFGLQEKMCNPIVFVSSSDPDVMYVDQSMKEPDHLQFWEAMRDKVSSHFENGNMSLFPRKNVPERTKVLSLVWEMKRKRRIDTRKVYTWTAHLNVHGGNQ